MDATPATQAYVGGDALTVEVGAEGRVGAGPWHYRATGTQHGELPHAATTRESRLQQVQMEERGHRDNAVGQRGQHVRTDRVS